MSPTSEESSGDTSGFMTSVHLSVAMMVWALESRLCWVTGTGLVICRLASPRFLWQGHSLESLVRESTTAGSRHGRLGGGSSQCMQSWRHDGILPSPSSVDPSSALYLGRLLSDQEESLCYRHPGASRYTASGPRVRRVMWR